jgi:phosphonatase-like hydrolase
MPAVPRTQASIRNLRFSRWLPVLALLFVGAVGPAAAAPRIKLVVLDMGGTIIQDHGEVPKALKSALSRRNIPASDAEISDWRGASKRGMVRHFVERSKTPKAQQAALIESIYADFAAQTDKAYADVQPIAGAEDALKRLKAGGYLLATTTGFGRELTDAVIRHLGWKKYFVANISSDDVEDGRPAPYMLFRAMEAAHVDDVREMAVVGDTVLDLQAGNNSGASVVVGVYSGAQSEAKLRSDHSTAILPSVASLPEYLKKND